MSLVAKPRYVPPREKPPCVLSVPFNKNKPTQGTLPFRALALRYGADTVFTEEVVDRRVLNAVRTENSVLGTVDYVEVRGKKSTAIPFQTCALERDRVVYQIGTGDAVNALRAAQVGYSTVC